jgi:hypothetical protein
MPMRFKNVVIKHESHSVIYNLSDELIKHYEVIVIVIAWGDRPRSGEENPKESAPKILSPERAQQIFIFSDIII